MTEHDAHEGRGVIAWGCAVVFGLVLLACGMGLGFLIGRVGGR